MPTPATCHSPDATFDVVNSSLVIHNIPGREQRDQVLREDVRVLKPGGASIHRRPGSTAYYACRLRAAGLGDVHRSLPMPQFFMTARAVTASPADAPGTRR
jgi:ubiquinone/menaquinone biosynthesis C-methylase UbiE